MDTKEAFKKITEDKMNTKAIVLNAVDETKYEFINEDEIEACGGDEMEAYSEYCNGEAEDQVVVDLIKPHESQLTDDQQCDLDEMLKEHYEIN